MLHLGTDGGGVLAAHPLPGQLDALYAAESMDLSADLTVLQNMLKGQGLSK